MPSSAGFQDEFSQQAGDYARYRPAYPAALFAFLAEQAPQRECAWDAASGSGQAALGMAQHFARVVASDASEAQIRHAVPHAHIEYRVERCEHTTLSGNSVDLITVAQALHWLDLPAFYKTVQRVLKPKGVIAVWSYALLRIAPKLDAIIADFYHEVLGPYWPDARRGVERGYRDIDFPFAQIQPPGFCMQAYWDLDQLLGYLSTWSAVIRYRKATGLDPLVALRLQLAGAWGQGSEQRAIEWPLNLRVGHLNQ